MNFLFQDQQKTSTIHQRRQWGILEKHHQPSQNLFYEYRRRATIRIKCTPRHLTYFTYLLLNLFIWPCRAACRILVPRPGTEPMPPAVEAWSPNHCTAREVPRRLISPPKPNKLLGYHSPLQISNTNFSSFPFPN